MNSSPIQLDLLVRTDLEFIHQQLDRLDHKDPVPPPEIPSALSARPQCSFLGDLLKQNQNPLPLRSLFRIVVKRHAASCCLREHPYLDMGYWDTYSSFYSRCFKRFEKTCERLHFFRGPEEKAGELRDAFLAGESENCVNALGFTYLGFVVLRPTQSYCVGRTALAFDDRKGDQLPNMPPTSDPEHKGRPRSKGISTQSANLMGARLTVSAVPYLQQDVVTGMCATASVWTASQVLADRHDLHRFPYLEITRQAVSASSDDETISRGLLPHEIRRALLATGARVEQYSPTLAMKTAGDRRNVVLMREILYAFIESHVPVIILLPGHAVCCIGHLQPHIDSFSSLSQFAVDRTEYACMSSNHYLVSETLTRFHVHNDSYGPYDRIDFLDKSTQIDLNRDRKDPRTWFRRPVILGRGRKDPVDLKGLIVPMPPYVRTPPHCVALGASRTFAKLFTSTRFRESEYNVLWRSVMTKGSTFKQSLEQRGYNESLRRAYASLHMPKYIWLCELSVFNKRETDRVLGACDNRKIHGGCIFNASPPSSSLHPSPYRNGPYFIVPPQEEDQTPDKTRILLERSRLSGVGYDSADCFCE